ncbi:MAG TPA: FAD-dependent oxidoreductase, partial [Vicinamibacteria bacterium]|nr:FAD-dependent oxidoreductase [Vicinamibacteria bacterium]
DVAVVGAGVFGAWTAWHLRRGGLEVALVEAHGPGHSRASSGGETRVIRMGYGSHEIYTRWSVRSLELWKDMAGRAHDRLFHETGVLWMARESDPLSVSTAESLQRLGVAHERLDRAELERRWPQIDFGPIPWALYEPGSGVLLARRAVQRVVADAVAAGVHYVRAAVAPPAEGDRLESIDASGTRVAAGTFVFACGPWLPRLFPDVLGGRIFTTRQEVFYFGTRPGDLAFAPPAMPVWIDFIDEFYALPDLEGKGLKFGLDRHGPPIDVDRDDRLISPETFAVIRDLVGQRLPALRDAPIVGTEVCAYENTSSGDFVIDRHPRLANVWLVGGGSGHGFKHGPAVGEHVADRLGTGGASEARFSLATKASEKRRAIY